MFEGKEYILHLKIDKGIIEIAEIENSTGTDKINSIVQGLIARRYEYNEVKYCFENAGLDKNTIGHLLSDLI